MGNVRCYSILVRQDNPEELLFSEGMANAIRECNGAVILSGFNVNVYVSCIVFKTLMLRERCASMLDQMNVSFDCRDDALLDEKHMKGW